MEGTGERARRQGCVEWLRMHEAVPKMGNIAV